MIAEYKWAKLCKFAVWRARAELSELWSAITCEKPVTVILFKVVSGPHPVYGVDRWALILQKNVAWPEFVHRLVTTIFEGQRGKSYAKRQEDLNPCSVRDRGIRGDTTQKFRINKFLQGYILTTYSGEIKIKQEAMVETRGSKLYVAISMQNVSALDWPGRGTSSQEKSEVWAHLKCL